MDIDFISSGYIEVYYGDQFVSRHRAEREATESIINDPRFGEFTITYPQVRAVKKGQMTATITINGEISGNA